ncbi:MAG: peroxiredoxin Q/BCP [Oceanicoccus sp.]|jgi:peroxiredoxin Q/BCP
MNIGDMIPDIKLPSSSGKEVSLHDFKGKNIILYFYPKDDTPGCTKEACEFRDSHSDFSDLNAVVIGVSKDPLAKHEKFINKYELPFELLADEKFELLKAFDAWKEKSMFGKKYMGIVRSTFLINEEGKLVKEWKKVKVTDHVKEVLEALQELR